jgi:hypothetical protein
LLSKHQQVQVMEAAAILVHGTSLPPDRALWPSYMSGGSLASPRLSGTGLPRSDTPTRNHVGSPAATVSSFAHHEPPSSQFDDDELEGVNELEEDDDDILEEEDDEGEETKVDEEEEEDEMTDESDLPTSQFAPATTTTANTVHGRSRSHSVGFTTAASQASYHPYGSHGAGARMLPTSLGATSYGWGVISESGKSGKTFGGRSSASEYVFLSLCLFLFLLAHFPFPCTSLVLLPSLLSAFLPYTHTTIESIFMQFSLLYKSFMERRPKSYLSRDLPNVELTCSLFANSVHVSPKQAHVTPRSPMLIPNGNNNNNTDSMYSHQHPRLHHHHSRSTSSGNNYHGHHPYYHTPHQSISSFGSFTSSTSSYLPSSSVRSRDGMAGEMEEEAIMEEGMDGDYDAHARGYGYTNSRASDMYQRIAAVAGHPGGPNGSVAIGKSGMNENRHLTATTAGTGSGPSSKSASPERRRDEYMYDMELDME